MKKSAFNSFCQSLVNVGHIEDTKQRDIELSAIMSMGFIFLDLTDLQVKHLQRILAAYFPDKYIVYAEPDGQELANARISANTVRKRELLPTGEIKR